MFTAFTEAIATQRQHDIEVVARRHADRIVTSARSAGRPAVGADTEAPLAIRISRPADAAQLADLGRLDGNGSLSGRLRALAADGGVLLAESDGEIVAALALGDTRVAADPFRASAPAAALLRLRAEQLGAIRPSRRLGALSALRPRLH